MERPGLNTAEIGTLEIGLTVDRRADFRQSPARFVHAALVRRLELLDPVLSESLHYGGGGQSASDHPWAISPVLGNLEHIGGQLSLPPGRLYTIRVSALASYVLQVLDAAFDPGTPLGREPLVLNRFEFTPVPQHIRWHRLRTYAGILTRARPQSSISVRFMSPTVFKSRREQDMVPSFRLCVEGWLRKWNAFSPVEIPVDDILAFAEGYASVTGSDLRLASVQFGGYALIGVSGTVTWEISEEPSILSRLSDALTTFAGYCGTGRNTAQGMGQTRTVRT